MADGLNSCFFLGNLGQDPVLKVASNGTAILTMSLACSESYLDRNRERQEKTEWVRIVLFGRRAEALSKFLSKGMKVFVEGKLSTSSWEDRETGQKRYRTEIIASNVIVGGSNNPRNKPKDPEHRRPNRRDDDDEPQGGGGGGGYDDSDYGSSGGGGDDDIPFACITRPDREHWWRF
jgi:single-strand DNA-binding protein